MLSKQYKIFFFTLSALLFGLTSKGQITFNNYYNAGSGNVSFAIQIEVFNEDTTYLVYSPWQNQASQQGLRLLKLNKNGGTLIDNKFMFGNLVFSTFLNNRISIKTSTYSSLVMAPTYFGSNFGMIFCKINNKLADTINTKYYCDYTYNYGLSNRFLKNKNQVWYFGNKFKNDNIYVPRPVIFKVDTNGNYIGQTDITSLLSHTPRALFYDSLLKRIYLAGTNNTIPQTPVCFVACVDTLGNVIWNKQIGGTADISTIQYIEKVNNELIICGAYNANGNYTFPEHKLELIKINATNGNTIWQKLYGQMNEINNLRSLVVNNDGSIVSSGTYAGYHQPYDGVILKVNSQGDSLWMNRYSNYQGNVVETFYDIKKAPDGGYILCGSPDYLNGCQSWVVKTDSLGIAPGINTAINEMEFTNKELNIYPNPANNILNIILPENQMENEFTLEIFNGIGQLVKENVIVLQNKTIVINTSNLANGIYLLNLKGNKSQTSSKRFVIAR